MPETVAIIGASEKKNRFAHKAMLALHEHVHEVKLINPFKENIEEQLCFNSVSDIKEKINTVTLYVNPYRFRDHIEEDIQVNPERVILNPGTEDTEPEKNWKLQE